MSKHQERLEDELIVLRCQEGHRASFSLLVERWHARLVRHARGLVWREDAALDVVQDTWLVVAKNLRSLKDPTRLRGWLYGIVTRRAADWLRKSGKAEAQELTDTASSASGRDTSNEVDAVRTALGRLPLEKRALLSMRYADDLDLEEIAEALNVPVGTVKSRLHHARADLRAELERSQR